MAIPGFFKQNKPHGFNYVPRYYDPQKEEWEQKKAAGRVELNAESAEQREESAKCGPQGIEQREETGETKPYHSKIMRGSMRNYFPRSKERVQKQNMIRFVVILLILLFVIFIYLRY